MRKVEPDEVVSVLFGEGHEGTAHDNELDLVHTVPQLLQLVNPVFCLMDYIG